MVKTDLKGKKHVNLEETHIATWHQQTFNFNKAKLFFLWQNLIITVWLHSKVVETQAYGRKKLFMLQIYKEFYQGNHHQSKTFKK